MENASPTPGIDYPRTFDEMDDWFRTEAQCRDYIRRLCWPNGFVCERCGVAGEPWVTARGVFRCKACDGSMSLTAGTVLQDTHKPLRTWFLAMWFITSQKNGMSALGLQRVLGLGSYETAWTLLHKLQPWYDRDVIDLPAKLKSMKPTLAALKRASGDARLRKSPSSWLRQRKTAAQSGVSD